MIKNYESNRPYRILIIAGSGSEKTNVLLNLIQYQWTVSDKIYLFVKNPFESKYQLPVNRREKIGSKTIKNPKAFIYYSQAIMMFMKI